MALARACFVPMFALAALFGGTVESALADRAATGIGRAQPCDADPAAVENSAEADTTDVDVDPHDRDWLVWDPPSPALRRSGAVHFLDAAADIVALRRPRSATLIRGPPVRG